MNLPTVQDAITKGRVQRTNRKTIQNRVESSSSGSVPKPKCSPRVDGTVGASFSKLWKVAFAPDGKYGHVFRTETLERWHGVAHKPSSSAVKLSGVPYILLRRSVALRIAHDAVAIDVKPVVVAVKGEVAPVQGDQTTGGNTGERRVKTPHAVAHVRLVSIGHTVAVGVGNTGVEVDAVAVFIQLSGETLGKPGAVQFAG